MRFMNQKEIQEVLSHFILSDPNYKYDPYFLKLINMISQEENQHLIIKLLLTEISKRITDNALSISNDELMKIVEHEHGKIENLLNSEKTSCAILKYHSEKAAYEKSSSYVELFKVRLLDRLKGPTKV